MVVWVRSNAYGSVFFFCVYFLCPIPIQKEGFLLGMLMVCVGMTNFKMKLWPHIRGTTIMGVLGFVLFVDIFLALRSLHLYPDAVPLSSGFDSSLALSDALEFVAVGLLFYYGSKYSDIRG